jgi:phosphoheptose isomerase
MKWELERDEMIEKAAKDPAQMEKVTRQLVHTTQSQQAKLAMKNAESVVRGYSHVVREAIGHLDVATPAELLQDAKDAFRTSAVSSLYGASRVYPVLMSPVDWSQALDTGFSPEDLAENPDMISMMIQSKSGALDVLIKQLATLQGSEQGDPSELRGKVEEMAQALEKAEADLHSKYLDSTIQLAKIVIAVSTSGASVAVEEVIKDVGILDAIANEKNEAQAANDKLKASVKGLDLNGTVEDVIKQVKGVCHMQSKIRN